MHCVRQLYSIHLQQDYIPGMSALINDFLMRYQQEDGSYRYCRYHFGWCPTSQPLWKKLDTKSGIIAGIWQTRCILHALRHLKRADCRLNTFSVKYLKCQLLWWWSTILRTKSSFGYLPRSDIYGIGTVKSFKFMHDFQASIQEQ